MANKVDKIVDDIGGLNLEEVKELQKKLGQLGLPPLSIGVPVMPKTSPPTLINNAEVEIPQEVSNADTR